VKQHGRENTILENQVMVDGCSGVQAGKHHDGVSKELVNVTPVEPFA
jgi:hypothetical protein